MGKWDSTPWGNDDAADWFAGLFTSTGFHKQVEEALTGKEPIDDENFPKIRAAASLVATLGRVYVWPIEDLDRHNKLAHDRLKEILDCEDLELDEEETASIRQDLKVLKKRLADK